MFVKNYWLLFFVIIKLNYDKGENNMAKKAEVTNNDKALEEVMAEIEKQFGKGSIMKLSEDTKVAVETVPTG